MSARIAKVVVDLSLDREFDYEVPNHLADSVQLGSQVVVPFGHATKTGYVVGFADRSERKELKQIGRLECETPLVGENILRLARWVSDYYAAPVETAVRAVLPAIVRRRGKAFKQLLHVTATDAAHALGILDGLRGKAPQQAAALEAVLAAGVQGIAQTELVGRHRIAAAAVKALAAKGLVAVGSRDQIRHPLAGRVFLRTEALSLMPQQAAALDTVKHAIDTLTPPVVLLYGVTGSGKTEVYLQAIDHALRQGRGAIVLVPEIALTPQTLERFCGRFGECVAVLHSSLSDGERHDEWHRIRDGKARIVIGARSAVFAPVRDLGLIVVDEEHENTYKQDEVPRYNARDVAVMRGHQDRCAVVLGSATPCLESYWNCQRGKYGLVTMHHRVDHRQMPVMKVVDMRIETERQGHAVVFSRELTEAIRQRLERAEQVILFLNRRGYASSLVCPKCGFVAACDACSVAYTYHRQGEILRCHICGAHRAVPAKCPKCQDPAFKYAGIGTQRLESVVSKFFPQARVQRMDADTTRGKDSHWRILGDFRTGKIDILIGTQMIAKGLDLPNVTLIGIVNADMGLHMPDFRAGERTFQLLTQVAGRAGRGDVPGEVIVQTYTPFHVTIQAARRLDFVGFFDQEIEFRRELNYPPFRHLICLTVRGAAEEKVKLAIASLAAALVPALPQDVVLSDPAPAPLARAKGEYRYQLMLRGPSTRAMSRPTKVVLQQMKWPDGVSVSIDVDALSLM